MVFGDGYGEKFAFPSGLQRMNHTECQCIVAIVPHIGVENNGDFVGSQRP